VYDSELCGKESISVASKSGNNCGLERHIAKPEGKAGGELRRGLQEIVGL